MVFKKKIKEARMMIEFAEWKIFLLEDEIKTLQNALNLIKAKLGKIKDDFQKETR